jgi:hypothetical protein
LVTAVGAAVALVAIVALTDRFSPDLLPFGSSEILPENYPRARLNFPLDYWNGLATLLAMGLAPLLWVLTSGRTLVGKSVSAGMIPFLAFAVFMTASRGGLVSAALVLVTMLILFPMRIWLLVCMLIPAVGSVLLILLIDRPRNSGIWCPESQPRRRAMRWSG